VEGLVVDTVDRLTLDSSLVSELSVGVVEEDNVDPVNLGNSLVGILDHCFPVCI
jgi:hypothetical protein